MVILAAGALFAGWRQKKQGIAHRDVCRFFHKLALRFKRPAPLLYLALASAALLAGSLYVHTNGPSNGYRIPRVLHWLAAGQWHWIHTEDKRMNVVACGFEWLFAPLILFARTDRLIFLINVVSYLMLPGLIFGVFTKLWVRPRVAWWWMWLLASGWCFAIQASSDLNDSFATIYALAAVYFALRARESQAASDLWLSMLAAGLLTGAKQTNLPLALLWLVAAWPSARLLLNRPVATSFVIAVSLLVSALPITLLNIGHTGSWQGLTAGEKEFWSAGGTFFKILGNIFSIPLQNLVPPYFPWSAAWERVMAHFLQSPFGAHFAMMERFGHLGMGISEVNAGIGLGICLLAAASIVGARHGQPKWPACPEAGSDKFFRWLRLTLWLLLLAFMAGICSDENARLLSAYYVFLFPILLVQPGQRLLVRRRWWQRLGLAVMLTTVMLLVVSRDRPLFPARTILSQLRAGFPRSRWVATFWDHYAWPSSTASVIIRLKDILPPHERLIGYATGGGSIEPALWLPLGQRRVRRVLAEDTPEQLRSQGIHYVLVEGLALDRAGVTIEQWKNRYHGTVINRTTFLQDPYRPPGRLYLVCLNGDYALGKQTQRAK